MKFYIFSFKNRQYVLDIAFFIELLQDSLSGDITPILNDLDIEAKDIDSEISLNPDKIYTLVNDQIMEYKLTFDICEYVKRQFINQLYEVNTYKLLNILEHIGALSSDSIYSYLCAKYPIIRIDKETAYLEILNSGDVKDIEALEKYLEFSESSPPWDFNSAEEKKIILEYNNLNELMIALILYYNNTRGDNNSISASKQLRTT